MPEPGTAHLPTGLAQGEGAALALAACHGVKRQLKAAPTGQELTGSPNPFSSTPAAQSRGRPPPGPPCLCFRMAWQRGCHTLLLRCDPKQAESAPGRGKPEGPLGSWAMPWQQDWPQHSHGVAVVLGHTDAIVGQQPGHLSAQAPLDAVDGLVEPPQVPELDLAVAAYCDQEVAEEEKGSPESPAGSCACPTTGPSWPQARSGSTALTLGSPTQPLGRCRGPSVIGTTPSQALPDKGASPAGGSSSPGSICACSCPHLSALHHSMLRTAWSWAGKHWKG